MKLLRVTALATMLGLSSAVCATASTDSNYVCMISGAGINVHWKTDTAGNYYEMMVDAPKPGATGYAAVGWNPTNPTGNKMFGATVMMGSTADLNTVKRYLPTNTNAANIIATETAIPSTITQTAITSTSTPPHSQVPQDWCQHGQLVDHLCLWSHRSLVQPRDWRKGVPQPSPWLMEFLSRLARLLLTATSCA